MYQFFKRTVRSILPKSWLKRMEPGMRRILTVFYKGNKHLCPICETRLKKWIVNTNGYDLICPRCSSIQRKRLLFLYLQKELQIEEKKLDVLDFSPSKGLSRKLSSILGKHYVASDYSGELASNRYDITKVPLKDASFDLILCYHVLEHVPNDAAAMGELFRLLRPGGLLMAQVPFKDGETLEEDWINTPELREEHYGQNDHVRFYGRADFVTRLEKVGFNVEECAYSQQFHEKEIDALGLNPKEIIFLCRKRS